MTGDHSAMVASVRHAMADCDMRDQERSHTRVTYDVDTWTSGNYLRLVRRRATLPLM